MISSGHEHNDKSIEILEKEKYQQQYYTQACRALGWPVVSYGCEAWTLNKQKKTRLECGLMPNAMAALPNTGGALCSRPQSLANAYQSAVQ